MICKQRENSESVKNESGKWPFSPFFPGTIFQRFMRAYFSYYRSYSRLYRAIQEEQKEFVAHSYCQLLLHSRWMNGLNWTSKSTLNQFGYILLLILCSPILCLVYGLSPKRDHKDCKGPLGSFLRQLDRPFNR